MTTAEHVMAGLLVLGCVAFYFVYWLGWCWAWYYVWPHGPQWITRPSFFGFSLTCFTAVIITLMILKPD